MPRVVQLLALAVGLSCLSAVVSAPIPKELKATPTRLVLRFGGPTLDPKKMDWGVDLTVEWERSKEKPWDEQAGMRITKWQASSPFPVFDEATLRAKGTAEPKDGNSLLLKSDADRILFATKTREVAASWESNNTFGFSPQPGEVAMGPSTVRGLHRLTATVELFASKTKQFDFTVDNGQPRRLAAAGVDTSRPLSGNVTFFFAESPADGLIHTSVHGGLGGGSIAVAPNALRLPAKGKLEQSGPLKLGNGFEGEWRVEYTGGSK